MMPERAELARDFLVVDAPAPVVRLAPYVTRSEPVVENAPSARLPRGPVVVAIGAFDGFHVGHRALIERTVADARAQGMAAWAVTFDPDPDEVVAPAPAPRLLSVDDRLGVLAASGVDGVLVIPFTPELAALDHASFFEQVLFAVLDVRAIHVGSDFRLGARGASTVSVMQEWCAARGVAVYGHDLVFDGGSPVSATRIRARLAACDVAGTTRELGRRYLVRGHVEGGRGEGTGMGFPTANIAVDPARQMPGAGVYGGLALVDGTVWPAAINVGLPPTYRDLPGSAALEANLIGFSGDLYGRPIALAFDSFLRPSRTFASTDELIATVLGNIDAIRAALGDSGVVLA